MSASPAARRLSRREFAYLLLIATAIGALGTVGDTMTLSFRHPPMRTFVSGLLSSVGGAVLLLVCLTIASSLDLGGWRRSAVYVSAGVIAVAALILMNWYGVNELTFLLFGSGPGGRDILRSSDHISLQLLWVNIPRPLLGFILVALAFMHFRDAQQRAAALDDVQLEQAKFARDTYESRLRTAQARVDPQFLFETLRRVQALYAADFAAAQGLLDDLILFLRRALPAIDSPTSSVAAEVALARAWLRIVEVRREGRLRSSVRVDADADRLRLPPMMLLPMVQRAVGGEAGSETHVDVDIAVAGDRLRVAVAAFPGCASFADVESVEANLASLYGASASLSVRELDHGLRLVLDLPGEATAISAASG